jgi:hypothetical protein
MAKLDDQTLRAIVIGAAFWQDSLGPKMLFANEYERDSYVIYALRQIKLDQAEKYALSDTTNYSQICDELYTQWRDGEHMPIPAAGTLYRDSRQDKDEPDYFLILGADNIEVRGILIRDYCSMEYSMGVNQFYHRKLERCDKDEAALSQCMVRLNEFNQDAAEGLRRSNKHIQMLLNLRLDNKK